MTPVPTYNETAVLENFGLCVLAFMIIVALHLMSLHFAIRTFHRHSPWKDVSKLRYHQTLIVILSAMLLLFTLHLATNASWGALMYWTGVLPAIREGVYYSLENYTGLGLTRVNVSDEWRMLAPMISLSGVFCLSWSTAVLVSFFGQIYHMRLED